MPAVTITLTDTPAGGVAIHTDFKPAIGRSCSPAQSAALEIFNRTRKDWGVPTPARSNVLPADNALEQSPETGHFPHDA